MASQHRALVTGGGGGNRESHFIGPCCGQLSRGIARYWCGRRGLRGLRIRM